MEQINDQQVRDLGILTDPETATPDVPSNWHLIDWGLVELFVGKLQTRIAQAEQNKNYRMANRLSRSLVRSWQAKALAVRRVTTNQGKRTAGTDRELWSTPDAKWAAVCRLNKPGYKARPLRRIYIPKSNGKVRPLGIHTMFDRAMQALYHLALDPKVECKSDPNSYGFRKGRSTHDACGQLFISLSKDTSAQWILDADISGFFDNINHDWLLANVPMDKRILRQWLKAGFLDKGCLYRTEVGTPQGGIISPTLANFTLNGLESGLHRHLLATLGSKRGSGVKVNVVRYADDFVVTGISKELLVSVVQPWIEQFLRERGLFLSAEKTRLVSIFEGFDFLGWNFRKYESQLAKRQRGFKLLIKPSRKSVSAFYDKVRTIIGKSLSVPTQDLIKTLNPILRGWARYHRGVVAKKTFTRLDSLIHWRLRRWGSRRHPRKTGKWVYQTYWLPVDHRVVFTATGVDAQGEPVTSVLYRLGSTKIDRHHKVFGKFNPYDPSWERYSEIRSAASGEQSILSAARLKLWQEQGGYCALCEVPMNSTDPIDDHHIVYRMYGGSNALANRVLMHSVCHRRVHALGLEVTKPASA
ncbi:MULTISPECIES: group II intron reverse transcriptase/maturase [Ramlibacter]|uniref:Group II intron reverse transcriptase/maturase n=1 Tax=Ramlibacter aquaticus TaxID=2780094 RepID=A0ABR9SAW2_9BURK|nr:MULTISPECIES: group II intron reverse transcriptase/maturase [Ramlibacter]MBE7939489.1 group II intron reverse transcriptase/maturase [Ramlibacter aquaticus]